MLTYYYRLLRFDFSFFYTDIKAKTVSEEYTALHLAACYLRHACKPVKSAKPSAQITEELDGANEPPGEHRRFWRTQSLTSTLQPPRYASRRGGYHRQTSCKELFRFLVQEEEIDVRMFIIMVAYIGPSWYVTRHNSAQVRQITLSCNHSNYYFFVHHK